MVSTVCPACISRYGLSNVQSSVCREQALDSVMEGVWCYLVKQSKKEDQHQAKASLKNCICDKYLDLPICGAEVLYKYSIFVNSNTRVMTNHVEAMWQQAKAKFISMFDPTNQDMIPD